MEKVFEFKKNFESEGIILEPTQCLYLASGNTVRIFFTPKGQIMAIPKSSLNNGDVKVLEETEYALGNIPELPKKAE